jgi:hypothetical protein
MTTSISSLSGHFIHGVDLEDFYPCWNLALTGTLSSPDFSVSGDAGLYASHQPIRDTPIERLRTVGLPPGMVSPRARCLISTANEDRHVTERRAAELAFEEARRALAPDAPSRLSSLYLAEDSQAGRNHVRSMLGSDIHILRVSVPICVRSRRVDTAWFDCYWDDPAQKYIENYWQSVQKESVCTTWELLIDGVIQADDIAGLDYLKANGAHLKVEPNGVFRRILR